MTSPPPAAKLFFLQGVYNALESRKNHWATPVFLLMKR
jgi:hypothetical protein